MNARPDRRFHPRLNLSYPIRIDTVSDAAASRAGVLGRTVTQNLGSRGAYFSTFQPEPYSVGQEVSVVLTVPHRLATGGHHVMLDLHGKGRIVRVDGPQVHRRFGENGLSLSGVAIEFTGPLSFQYRWA